MIAIAVSIMETVQVIICLFCQEKMARITGFFLLVWGKGEREDGIGERTARDYDEDTEKEDGKDTKLLLEWHAQSEDLGDGKDDD
jgi:hypothetical protein